MALISAVFGDSTGGATMGIAFDLRGGITTVSFVAVVVVVVVLVILEFEFELEFELEIVVEVAVVGGDILFFLKGNNGETGK